MEKSVNQTVKTMIPATVLDFSTMVAAGKHEEELYCANHIDISVLFNDSETLKGKKYEVVNYLFMPHYMLENSKLTIDEVNARLIEYPFFKGSKKSPYIFGINVSQREVNVSSLIDLVKRTEDKNKAGGVVNFWLLVEIEGSKQAIFIKRIINKDLLEC